jgi:hypothetical protein
MGGRWSSHESKSRRVGAQIEVGRRQIEAGWQRRLSRFSCYPLLSPTLLYLPPLSSLKSHGILMQRLRERYRCAVRFPPALFSCAHDSLPRSLFGMRLSLPCATPSLSRAHNLLPRVWLPVNALAPKVTSYTAKSWRTQSLDLKTAQTPRQRLNNKPIS